MRSKLIIIIALALALCSLALVLRRQRVRPLKDYSDLSELQDGLHIEKRISPNGKVFARDINADPKNWRKALDRGLI